MIYRRPSHELLAELRYALQVMEEKTHLGLDDPTANKLKTILLRRIGKMEDALDRDRAISTTDPISPLPEIPE
jgi:hypothetical protein